MASLLTGWRVRGWGVVGWGGYSAFGPSTGTTSTNSVTDAFQSYLLTGTYKIALYVSSAILDGTTTAYTATGEAVGTGYVAGGTDLTVIVGPVTADGVTYMSFSDVSWTGVITARGALIYDVDRSNLAVMVLDFGTTKTSAHTFPVHFPPALPTSALFRVKRG